MPETYWWFDNIGSDDSLVLGNRLLLETILTKFVGDHGRYDNKQIIYIIIYISEYYVW